MGALPSAETTLADACRPVKERVVHCGRGVYLQLVLARFLRGHPTLTHTFRNSFPTCCHRAFTVQKQGDGSFQGPRNETQVENTSFAESPASVCRWQARYQNII